MTDKPSFFAELKRRNVLRAGMLYAAGAWLLVQVATQVFPFFDIPNWVVRWIVIAAAIGFPFALALSWFYEFTPEGLKAESEIDADPSIVRSTGKALDRWIIVVLSLAVVLLLANTFVLHKDAAGPAQSSTGNATTTFDKSIAVLPFENLSSDKDNAYFADGMQDEILTRLSKIGTLRVISRTSTLPFASHPGNLPEIAAKLGVATILEGSVQKAGNTVRINVQLIRALGDQHLWAETYDRTLDDVFGVQGEVAGAIANKLGATLSGDARKQVDEIATRNAAASDAYLRGLSLMRQGYVLAQESAAIHAFEDAVKADPHFAAAWARLARGYSHLIFTGDEATPQRRTAALHALETAEQLQPDTLETLAARAYYIFRVQGDYDAARKRFEALHARWPNDVDVMLTLSYVLARQGHQAEADALVGHALTLDPLNVQLHKLLAINAIAGRRFDDAIAEVHAVRVLAPADAEAPRMEARAWLARGDLARASALLDHPPTLPSEESGQPEYFDLERQQRSYATSIARLERMLKTPDPKAGPFDSIGARMELADMQRLAGDRAAQGNYRVARDAVQDLLKKQAENLNLIWALAWCDAGLGNETAAFAGVDAFLRHEPESKDVILARYALEGRARLLARFGHKHDAVAGLRYLLGVPYDGSMYSTYSITPAMLRLDPDFDTLRGDLEFHELAAGDAATPATSSGTKP